MHVAALTFCLLVQAGDLDAVHRKDGRVHRGRIVSEAGAFVVLEILVKGAKGQTVGSGKITIPQAEIAKIVRASKEGREKVAARAAAFTTRRRRLSEAMAKMKLEPASFEGVRGVKLAGERFNLYSTCDDRFVKESAFALEEVFAAYGRFFDVRRNKDRKVAVYLLSSRAEYEAFLTRKHGRAVLNTAIYDPENNLIAAANLIQKAEERRIRQEILKVERTIEDIKRQATEEERKVDRQARDARARIAADAARIKNQIRRDSGGGKPQRLASIDRQKRDLFAKLKKQEAAIDKELKAYKKRADEVIKANRKVIADNRKVLRGQNSSMFETLFHEGFHAFATNHLWEAKGKVEIPRWLHEGMASYFEMSVVEAGELIHGAPHAEFLKTCKEKIAAGKWLPVEQVVRGGPDKFLVSHHSQEERSGLYYAESWALAHYVSDKVGKEAIEKYVGAVVAGADTVAEFEKMMGRPWREVNTALKKHVLALK